MKKEKSFSKVSLNVELSYVSPGAFKEGSNSCDWNNPTEVAIVKAAHMNDDAKKILHSTIRANFHVEIEPKNKNISQVVSEMNRLNTDEKIQKVIMLSKELQEYILSVTKPVFPDLPITQPEIVEKDWMDKAKFNKKTVEYNTNIFRWSTDPSIETKILDILQKFVDESLEEHLNLQMHYNCWAYYYKQRPIHETPLQEIINHRRKQISL